MEHPVLLSSLLGINPAYQHVFYTWCAMAVLFGLGLFLRGRLTLVPSGLQNIAEVIIGGLEQFTVDTIGEKGRAIFPLLCGIFLFILVQNLFGLIPFMDAPTANLNTNAAMALFVFCYYNYVGLRTWGPGYIKHFMGPIPLMAPLMTPIELVSHAARPVSLSLRLFGNIKGEEIVLLLAFTAVPLLTTLPAYCLFLLVKVLQAFIFYMLTMLYLQGAMEHPPH